MHAESRIRDYYDALRDGESLYPYFAEDAEVVKFGITERLAGYEEIEAGLKEQTRTTEDWRVDSRALDAVEREEHAWFADEVGMAWSDTRADRDYEFDSRWSGTLERREGEWLFVGMHVSTAWEG